MVFCPSSWFRDLILPISNLYLYWLASSEHCKGRTSYFRNRHKCAELNYGTRAARLVDTPSAIQMLRGPTVKPNIAVVGVALKIARVQ